MKTKITAKIGGVDLQVKMFKFSGGEYQVSIRNIIPPIPHNEVEIEAYMLDGDVMPLLLVADAIRNYFPTGEFTTLRMPYLPYARQDRVMNKGESLAVKVFTNAVNSLEFKQVIVTDAHSDVGVALLNNCFSVPAHVVASFRKFGDKPIETLVAPDAGALKKTFAAAKYFGITDVIRADKVRDVTTGNITGTEVYGDVADKEVLIMDDICDGGRTFLELAKVLKARGASKVYLHVTHGLFSQGKGVFDGIIDAVHAVYDYEEMFK